MKEISDKLAYELKSKLDVIEKWCDEKAKEGRPRKGDVDTDWMTASVWLHDMRVHLYHHMEDMIHHPDFPEVK